MVQIVRKSKLTAKQNKLICSAYSIKVTKSQFDQSWNHLKKEVDSLRQQLNADQIIADNGDGLGERGFIFVSKERSYFDVNKFSKENPELYKKYLTKRPYFEYKPVS